MAFSYSPTATFEPPKVPRPTNSGNPGRGNHNHSKHNMYNNNKTTNNRNYSPSPFGKVSSNDYNNNNNDNNNTSHHQNGVWNDHNGNQLKSPFGKAPANSTNNNQWQRNRLRNHNKSQSSPIRPKTPPPPKKLPTNNHHHNKTGHNTTGHNKSGNKLILAKAQPLAEDHPLRRNKVSKKADSMNFIPTNKTTQPQPHSGANNKRLPPRPWPPR